MLSPHSELLNLLDNPKLVRGIPAHKLAKNKAISCYVAKRHQALAHSAYPCLLRWPTLTVQHDSQCLVTRTVRLLYDNTQKRYLVKLETWECTFDDNVYTELDDISQTPSLEDALQQGQAVFINLYDTLPGSLRAAECALANSAIMKAACKPAAGELRP